MLSPYKIIPSSVSDQSQLKSSYMLAAKVMFSSENPDSLSYSGKHALKFILLTALLLGTILLRAQLPDCVMGSTVLYMHNTLNVELDGTENNVIENWDVSQPILPGINPSLNSIQTPFQYIMDFKQNAEGLAIGKNINGAGPEITFYMVQPGYDSA